MISKYTEYDGNTIYYATSSDDKPTAENGNMLVEADTGKVYIYNAEEPEWVEMFTLKTTEGEDANAE